jgi:hypothetical protein
MHNLDAQLGGVCWKNKRVIAIFDMRHTHGFLHLLLRRS